MAMSWATIVQSACTSLRMRGKSTLQGLKSLMLRKTALVPFPRQMYNDLLELIARGNQIIADYVKTSNIPLQSPYHAYIDKLEFSINVAKQKAREIESTYKIGVSENTLQEMTRIMATLKDLIDHRPNMTGNQEAHSDTLPVEGNPHEENEYDTLSRTFIRNGSKKYQPPLTCMMISNYQPASAITKSEKMKPAVPPLPDEKLTSDFIKASTGLPAVATLVNTATFPRINNSTRPPLSNTTDKPRCGTDEKDISKDQFNAPKTYLDEFFTSKSGTMISNSTNKSVNVVETNDTKISSEPLKTSEDDAYDRVYEQLHYLKPESKYDKRSMTSFVTPSAVVSLDRFTSNLYLVPDFSANQLLVVFGSAHINTIKVYDTQGNGVKEITLTYDWDSHNAYQVECVTRQRQIVLNEIKGYQIADGVFSLKQRLMFFNYEGGFITASKRLIEVSQPLESVTVDSDGSNIYVFDTTTLMCVNHWVKKVDKISRVSVGTNFIACLGDNQIIICNKEGHQKFSWTATCRSSKHFKPVCLQVFHNSVYVLGWAMEAWPPNNLLIGYDEEGRILRELFVPNRILENSHGEFEFDFGSRRTNAYASNPAAFMLWAQNAVWPSSFGTHDPNSVWNWTQFNDTNWNSWNIPQSQERYDPTWFYATWFAITDNSTAIITNITFDQPRYSSKKIIFLSMI